MVLIPSKSTFNPDDDVVIEFDAPVAEDAVSVLVTHLHEEVRSVPVNRGARSVSLGSFGVGGYGVSCGTASTAFDVLHDPFDRPRYGFVAALSDASSHGAVTLNFRRLHLNLVQFYDWAYRHSTLMPSTNKYLDPLGLERDLSIMNALAEEFVEAGAVPLGYTAVYAVAADEVEQWQGSIIYRSTGEPYRLGENFLVLVDPAEERWLEHYLGQLEEVLHKTALSGFHLDQYGWPKFAVRQDGTRVDLAASYVELLAQIRRRLPHARFMFNNVNNFPTYATAGAPQDATYIEVWDPHNTYQDVAALISAARSVRPEHPPILSAYLSCFAGPQRDATSAAELLMATVFSSGGSHLLFGESRNVLTGPYYADNAELERSSQDRIGRMLDFVVRYGDLLFDPEAADVSEFFMGGINEDFTFADSRGTRFSTKPEPGTVWTRAFRTRHGISIHLINLVAQTETSWDSGKEEPKQIADIEMTAAPVAADARLYVAGDRDAVMTSVTSKGRVERAQSNALSAGQSSIRFALPPLNVWTIVHVPGCEIW